MPPPTAHRLPAPFEALNAQPTVHNSASVQGLRALALTELGRSHAWGVAAGRGELEPDVCGALVDAPAGGERFDDGQASTADIVWPSLAHLVLESSALVDDFTTQARVVELEGDHDVALPVNQCVGHQLGEHEG